MGRKRDRASIRRRRCGPDCAGRVRESVRGEIRCRGSAQVPCEGRLLLCLRLMPRAALAKDCSPGRLERAKEEERRTGRQRELVSHVEMRNAGWECERRGTRGKQYKPNEPPLCRLCLCPTSGLAPVLLLHDKGALFRRLVHRLVARVVEGYRVGHCVVMKSRNLWKRAVVSQRHRQRRKR